jgi:hypothetical protein
VSDVAGRPGRAIVASAGVRGKFGRAIDDVAMTDTDTLIRAGLTGPEQSAKVRKRRTDGLHDVGGVFYHE